MVLSRREMTHFIDDKPDDFCFVARHVILPSFICHLTAPPAPAARQSIAFIHLHNIAIRQFLNSANANFMPSRPPSSIRLSAQLPEYSAQQAIKATEIGNAAKAPRHTLRYLRGLIEAGYCASPPPP